jgi:uncharacterized damage-inducible protein DinB
VSDVAAWGRALERNLGLLERMLDGVAPEGALRPIVEGGSSLNWMVGHVAASRDAMLAAAGAERLGGDRVAERYRDGTPVPAADAALPLDELMGLVRRQGERLDGRLAEMDDDALAAPSGMGDADVRRALEFLVWHETYHLGQAVLYRRALGLDSPIG